MNTRFVRHNLNKEGRCQWCGKEFTESEAKAIKRYDSPLVEPADIAHTETKSYAYEIMLKESERAEVVNCADPQKVRIAGESEPSEELPASSQESEEFTE